MKKINYPDTRVKRGARGDKCSKCHLHPRLGPTEAYCRACRTAYNQQRAEIRKIQVNKSASKRYELNDQIIKEAKDVPCADCGYSYPDVCMDFDHVRGTKIVAVSAMRTSSEKRLRDEIAKCDVVCANCHRIRTFERGQMFRTGSIRFREVEIVVVERDLDV